MTDYTDPHGHFQIYTTTIEVCDDLHGDDTPIVSLTDIRTEGGEIDWDDGNEPPHWPECTPDERRYHDEYVARLHAARVDAARAASEQIRRGEGEL